MIQTDNSDGGQIKKVIVRTPVLKGKELNSPSKKVMLQLKNLVKAPVDETSNKMDVHITSNQQLMQTDNQQGESPTSQTSPALKQDKNKSDNDLHKQSILLKKPMLASQSDKNLHPQQQQSQNGQLKVQVTHSGSNNTRSSKLLASPSQNPDSLRHRNSKFIRLANKKKITKNVQSEQINKIIEELQDSQKVQELDPRQSLYYLELIIGNLKVTDEIQKKSLKTVIQLINKISFCTDEKIQQILYKISNFTLISEDCQEGFAPDIFEILIKNFDNYENHLIKTNIEQNDFIRKQKDQEQMEFDKMLFQFEKNKLELKVLAIQNQNLKEQISMVKQAYDEKKQEIEKNKQDIIDNYILENAQLNEKIMKLNQEVFECHEHIQSLMKQVNNAQQDNSPYVKQPISRIIVSSPNKIKRLNKLPQIRQQLNDLTGLSDLQNSPYKKQQSSMRKILLAKQQ